MPRIKHVVEIDYIESFRSAKVAGMFDVPVTDKLRKEWDINLPIEDKPWQVGLIVGASGSGKSTIAKKAFGENLHTGFNWKEKCLLDDFKGELQAKEITEAMSRVGFSSPPQWLLPYSALSTGQKFRVELARCLLEYDDTIVFDEFTSVVDRQVAQISSFAFQKAVRKTRKKFVAVTCHYDVEAWLQPDWVLDVATGEFKWGCLRRPSIEIEIYRCDRKAWQLFKGHHYLSADISNSAEVYVALVNGDPAALCAVLHFPHPRVSNYKREHRVVVLPDYQGIGLGGRLSETVAAMYIAGGYRYISTTSHPSFVISRATSDKWVMTKRPRRNGKPGKSSIYSGRSTVARDRLTASFEYLGESQSVPHHLDKCW